MIFILKIPNSIIQRHINMNIFQITAAGILDTHDLLILIISSRVGRVLINNTKYSNHALLKFVLSSIYSSASFIATNYIE